MNLRKFTIVPMLALALFAVGCGADCESICEDSNECEGVTEKVNCEKSCEERQKEAEDKGCEDQYDDLESCMGDVEDICKITAKTCAKENTALNDCLM